MTPVIWIAAACCLLMTVLHVASILVPMVRSRPGPHRHPPASAPAVSLIRPVCGIDNFAQDTLCSAFALDYPNYKIIHCVAHATDPVVPLVRRLIAEHPSVPARLLVGDERISDNPKLNNLAKG